MPPADGPRRVLLTGGTGFVGANLARRLAADGHRVTLLVRPGHDRWRLAGVEDRFGWTEADLQDARGVRDAVRVARPQWVFHLAAHGAYPWQTDALAIMRANVVGTACLVEACLEAGCDALVSAGSSSEYGPADHGPAEDEAPRPVSRYGVAKAAATLYCTQAAVAAGAPIVTLRLYSVYGPWEDPRRFVARLVAQGMAGRLPPLAAPDTARDYVHVDDVCAAFLAAAAAPRPGAVYNVGTGVQTTLREAVAAAGRVLGVAAAPAWGAYGDRPWDTTTWVADPSRIRRELGWRASLWFDAGLAATAAWLRATPEVAGLYLTPAAAAPTTSAS